MGDAYAIVYLVLYGGYTLILLGVLWLGVFLLRFPTQKRAGLVILVLLVAWCVVPPLYDRVVAAGERRAIDAATILPDALSFEGQSVLVMEAGGTICGDLCGDLVRLGVPGDFYWLGIGDFSGDSGDRPNPDFEIINAGDQILRVELGPPNAEMSDMRFAEAVEGAEIPPFDVVIIDDNGYLRSYAPQLLDLPEGLIMRTQIARVMIEDWADPLSDPPPAATYRSVAPWTDVGAFIYWPLNRDDAAYPSINQVDAAWTAPICAQAAAPEDRDAWTYAYLCDPDALGEILGGGG